MFFIYQVLFVRLFGGGMGMSSLYKNKNEYRITEWMKQDLWNMEETNEK